jgi:hypothetical protein
MFTIAQRSVGIGQKIAPLCVAFTLAATIPLRSSGSAMFRGDLQHTGVYDARGVPELHGVKWTFKTGGRVYSSPAVADGVVFVGSTDGNLYAVDASTGAQKWKFATRGRIVSSPAVLAGVVYFESYDSNFYAVDAATGASKWKFVTNGERRFAAKHIHGMLPESEAMPDPFDFYLSSPAVSNGVVYFGSGDGNVYALESVTGTLKWKFQTGDVVHASPALAEGLLFIGSWDTYFYALDAASGAEKWRFKTGDDPVMHNQTGIQSSAAVANGVVYFGCRDWIAGRQGRQGVFLDIGRRTVPRCGRAHRRRAVCTATPLADVLVARARRQHRLPRLPRRQAARHRRGRTQVGLDVSDGCLARERSGTDQCQRPAELRGGDVVLVL